MIFNALSSTLFCHRLDIARIRLILAGYDFIGMLFFRNVTAENTGVSKNISNQIYYCHGAELGYLIFHCNESFRLG
jgi:hypothetical protein